MARYGRVVIAGAQGNLARALIAAAPVGCEIVPLPRAALDITDATGIRLALDDIRPDLVINGAAYNLVDKAESEPEAALRLNALGPAHLARACAARQVPLVHFSTDFVFDGNKRTPYVESDPTEPLSVYGASKLAGENFVLANSPQHTVIRVCRLFGPVPPDTLTQKPAGNFPLLMLKLAHERGKVRVVNDQVGSPSYTPDLAGAVWQLLETSDGGLFHLSNAGEVSFAEYARTIFQLAGVECELEDVTSEEYNAPAQRPLYSTLSNEKAHSVGVIPLRDWREALAEFLAGLDK